MPIPAITGMDTPIPPIQPQEQGKPKRLKRINRPRSLVRIKWSEEEDEKLRSLVEKYGKRKWKQISQGILYKFIDILELGSVRPDTECRQHYIRVLERKTSVMDCRLIDHD